MDGNTTVRGFDLQQLGTFVAVLDAGSMSSAASRVHRSQSTVSEQVRKLEEHVGMRLLTRGKSGIVPTPAGERLLGHARQILALSESAYRDLRGETLRGELRLAVTDYFRPGDIPRLLKDLNTRYPQMRVTVSVLASDEITRGYTGGAFDIGLIMRVLEGGKRRAERAPVLRREPLVWVAAPNWRASNAQTLPLVLLPESCQLHRLVVRLLRKRGLPHSVAHLASGVAGLQGALAAGLGVGCLNESALTPGLIALGPRERLPALPQAEFRLLPPRRGEAELVAQAREAVMQQLR